MESEGRGQQTEFETMNISTCGESGVYEFSGRSNQGIAWSNNCSQLAQYLTKKAASIDASIKWGKSCGEFEHEYPRHAHSSKRQHSQCSDQNQSKKRQRRATVGDLEADLQAGKELLAASIRFHREQLSRGHVPNLNLRGAFRKCVLHHLQDRFSRKIRRPKLCR